jgi:hypothetical protein
VVSRLFPTTLVLKTGMLQVLVVYADCTSGGLKSRLSMHDVCKIVGLTPVHYIMRQEATIAHDHDEKCFTDRFDLPRTKFIKGSGSV